MIGILFHHIQVNEILGAPYLSALTFTVRYASHQVEDSALVKLTTSPSIKLKVLYRVNMLYCYKTTGADRRQAIIINYHNCSQDNLLKKQGQKDKWYLII